jgi:small subunit ribosomal protein S1
MSQIDVRFVGDPATFVGQKLQFRVQRADERDVVLSRRALLEEEQQVRAVEARAKISVGAVVHGRVTSLASYGAFVDLGGIEGLLHVSEIGHGRLGHPQEVLAVGQEIEVQVLRIEPAKESAKPGSRREKSERISLSRKVLERDPWRDAVERYPVASEWPGRVMRLESFGAFVELAPGLEGLVHISELGASKRIQHAREAVQLGQDLRVRVLGVDAERRRISLTLAPQEKLRADESAEWQAGEAAASGEGLGSLGDFFERGKNKG